jgi:hypothetical protein
MSGEKGAGAGVIKLALVAALNNFDSGPKQCFHIGKEISKSAKGVRFESERKSP